MTTDDKESAMWIRINQAHDSAMEAKSNLSTHQVACDARQTQILTRLHEMEETIKWATRGLVGGMLILLIGIVWSSLRVSLQ